MQLAFRSFYAGTTEQFILCYAVFCMLTDTRKTAPFLPFI